MSQIFAALDTDEDGTVSAEELAAAKSALCEKSASDDRPKLSEALLANDDADGNGTISADELAASPVGDMMGRDFSAIDLDQDSQLSADEINQFEAKGPGQNDPFASDQTSAASSFATSPSEKGAAFNPRTFFESLINALAAAAADTENSLVSQT